MPAAFSADRFPSGGAARGLDLSRRRLLLSAPLVLTVPLLGGCATAVPTSTHLADALGSRLSAGDRAGFYALFAGSAGAQAVALRMFDNLLDSGATIAAASSDRLSVTWHLPGEPPVVSLATVTLAGAVVDAIEPVSTGTEWLSDPMTVHAEASLVVASARQDESARWLTAARAGLAALATVWPAGQRRTEPLIVLAPSDLVGFARYAGADAQTTAAVTVVPGTTASQGVRVVVNPVAATNAVTDAATLTHEAVHAAMGSPRLTGTPGWLLEGIAEALTARAHPSVAATNAAAARAAVAHGLPNALPDLSSADPSGYALAQVAVDAMVAHVGWTDVFDEARRRSTPAGGRIADAQVLTWYRDELARLR